MLVTGVYCCPRLRYECWPPRAKGGSRLARPLYGCCPPFTGYANRETLRAGHPSSVDGSAVVPLSELDFAGLTNGKTSTCSLMVSRTIPASGKSKRLRSASIVNRGCFLHSTTCEHTWRESNVKASFPLPYHLRHRCPQWQEAHFETKHSGRSDRPQSHVPFLRASAALANITDNPMITRRV